MSNGTNTRIPHSGPNSQVYAVGLTVEEMRSMVAVIEQVLGFKDWRKQFGCLHVTDANSGLVALKHRLGGRR